MNIEFDNQKINEFFIEKTKKDKYTYDDILKIFTTDEVRQGEPTFEYILKKEDFELGIIDEEPQIEYNVIEISDENKDEFNKLMDECYPNKEMFRKCGITIHDFVLLRKIKKDINLFLNIAPQYEVKESGFYISEDDEEYGSFDVRGGFENISIEELSKIKDNIKSVEINSFRGLTQEKLDFFGKREYKIAGDLGNPYSKQEIEELFLIMEAMKQNVGKKSADEDKFLSVYKSIGMYADYDRSGCVNSEEYIKGNDKLTRSLRGVLLQGKAVCAGYAHSLQYCCDYIGIEAPEVGGQCLDKNGEIIPNSNHAWNQVKLTGEWYNCDLTWDYKAMRKGEKLKHCLKSDDEFYKTHCKEKFYEFKQCNTSHDPEIIAEKLKNLAYTDLDKSAFDATETTKINEKYFERTLVATLQNSPNFSQEVLQALTMKEKKNEIER